MECNFERRCVQKWSFLKEDVYKVELFQRKMQSKVYFGGLHEKTEYFKERYEKKWSFLNVFEERYGRNERCKGRYGQNGAF